MRCLAKDPDARPTAAEVALALTSVADAAGVPPLEALELAGVPEVSQEPAKSRTTVSKVAPPTAEIVKLGSG
jgi:hypothetical protein